MYLICSDIDQLTVLLPYLDEILHEYREKNRLENPAPSGYCGIHRIYKKDGVCIELQIRTMLEHVWATSVESIDVLRGTAMKNGEDGAAWTEFFQLFSSLCALVERKPALSMHDGMDSISLMSRIEKLEQSDKIISKIQNYAKTHKVQNELSKYPNAYYVQIERKEDGVTIITGYTEEQVGKAYAEYEENERGTTDSNKVLVSVNNIKKISEIYPNYFTQLDWIASLLNDLLDLAHETN